MGRPDYQTLSATLPSQSWAQTSTTPDTALDAGQSEQITIYAPSGTTARVISMSMSAPAPTGASAGTHGCTIYLGIPDVTQGVSDYADELTYRSGFWQTATNAATWPVAGTTSQAWWLGDRTVTDDSHAIAFNYGNDTTAGTSPAGSRTYVLTYLVVDLP